jgi:hypothetical protein
LIEVNDQSKSLNCHKKSDNESTCCITKVLLLF